MPDADQGGSTSAPDLADQVAEKWVEIAPIIDRLLDRMGRENDFPVLPGSALVGDDRASQPYQLTSAVRACLSAAVDHLHAAKVLAHESGRLHLAAPSTLARGVIENAATGLWMITPQTRDERILRALRWWARNVHDQVGAGRLPPGRTKAGVLGKIAAVAQRRGIDPGGATNGYQMLKVIRQVDREHPDLRELEFTWQLCSGFAHGRPWAFLGALNREAMGSPEPGVSHIRLTSDPILAMFPILKGLFVVQRLLQIWEPRSGHHRQAAVPAWLRPSNASPVPVIRRWGRPAPDDLLESRCGQPLL